MLMFTAKKKNYLEKSKRKCTCEKKMNEQNNITWNTHPNTH